MRLLVESPNFYAKIAGSSYLLIIILGAVGYLAIRNPLIVYGDAALTANNILLAESLWRLSITGDVLMHALDIPVMIILFCLLKPVSTPLAVASVAFNLVQTAVLVANKLVLLLPLLLLKNEHYIEVFGIEQVHAQVMLLADLHDYGFGLGLIFFGLACMGYGLLIFKARYLPTFLGVLMMIAGASYLINSLALLMAPSVEVFPILVLSVLGELTLALWLLFKGVDTEKWTRALRGEHSCPLHNA